MHSYTYTIDNIRHKIKSARPLETANHNRIIPISRKSNAIFAQLKYLLREWMRLAEEHNIIWFCNGGTLLGAIRDKGFVHYDNDIDLVVLLHDYNTIKRLLSDTCVVEECEPGFQLHLKGRRFPFIDLWLQAPNPENPDEIILACPFVNNHPTYGANLVWPNEKYATQDIMNLVKLPFEDMMVNVPNNYETYVKRMYGDDCLVRYVIQEHTDDHFMVDYAPPPKTRMKIWESCERVNQLIGLDTCHTISGKETNVVGALIANEIVTPNHNKTKRIADILLRYVYEKIKHV